VGGDRSCYYTVYCGEKDDEAPSFPILSATRTCIAISRGSFSVGPLSSRWMNGIRHSSWSSSAGLRDEDESSALSLQRTIRKFRGSSCRTELANSLAYHCVSSIVEALIKGAPRSKKEKSVTPGVVALPPFARGVVDESHERP
jgi:hypothetical protein